jgi:hypothetical protein
MLRVFKAIRRHRFAAALMLAAFYTLCILAPHAAVALGGDPHCLKDAAVASHVHAATAKAEPHAHAGAMHQHDHRTVHTGQRQSQQSDGQGSDGQGSGSQGPDGQGKNHGTCCGLFCVTAIAFDVAVVLPSPPPVAVTTLLLEEACAGRGPTRINRPPIA